jgi:hypothetical protein
VPPRRVVKPLSRLRQLEEMVLFSDLPLYWPETVLGRFHAGVSTVVACAEFSGRRRGNEY